MVHLDQKVIVIAVASDVQMLRGQAKVGFEQIDAGNVGQDDGVVERVLTAALPFIVAKVEGAVLLEGAAQREAKLVLVQLIESGSGENALGIESIVAEILVHAAVDVIGPALGYDVDDAAHRPASLHAV